MMVEMLRKLSMTWHLVCHSEPRQGAKILLGYDEK